MASNTSLCLQQVFRRRKIQPTVTKCFLRQQTDSVCFLYVCSVMSCRRYTVTGSIPTTFLFERLAATKVKNLKKKLKNGVRTNKETEN